MSSFTVLLICIQACLIQKVFSQACFGAYGPVTTPTLASPMLAGPYGFNAPGLAYDGYAYPATGYAGAYSAAGCGVGLAPYGGAGEGNVAVVGELPVAGNTAVAGQVPIMGAVSFSGPVPAAGTVSISGKCACSCGSPYDYLY